MLNKERQQEILQILKNVGGFVSSKELCRQLFTSDSSIRRDLKELEGLGLIKRSYGGAALIVGHSGITAFDRRTRQNSIQKQEIAKKAATLIQDGDILFLDQSSSSFYLAEQLLHRSGLTVVTNNTEILTLLSSSNIKVFSSGGYLSDENRNCLIGGDAQRTFEQIRADLLFFSVRSLSSEGEVTDCSREEVLVRESMLKNARKKVLLCDSSKISSAAPYKQCHISEVDYLVCENEKNHLFTQFEGLKIL